MELSEIRDDPRFAVNTDRVKNREALAGLLVPLFADLKVAPTLATLKEAGIPCGPINDLSQVFSEPQVIARDMVLDMDVPEAGPTKLTGVPIKLSETPGAVEIPPPSLGQHTEEILDSLLGIGASARRALRDDGVI